MSVEPDIVSINLIERLAFWDDGWMSRITLHDADGEEVEDPVDCVFITSPTRDGRWAAAQRSAFDGATRH